MISLSNCDTFYNSSNLKRVNIPKNVKFMGNNPFAGCPNIEVINESPYFNLVDGVLLASIGFQTVNLQSPWVSIG